MVPSPSLSIRAKMMCITKGPIIPPCPISSDPSCRDPSYLLAPHAGAILVSGLLLRLLLGWLHLRTTGTLLGTSGYSATRQNKCRRRDHPNCLSTPTLLKGHPPPLHLPSPTPPPPTTHP